jgi:hypothetical protein
MSKINNTTAYTTTTPTNNTMFIGSETAGGATKNYKVSDLSAFINVNPSWTTLFVTGDATVNGDTSLNNVTVGGTLGVTGATTMSTLTTTGLAEVGGNLLVSGNLTVGSFSMAATPIFFNGVTVAGGTTNLATSAFADNAAAVAGGLAAGAVYRTDGTGAAPLNAAGILMVRV